MAIGTAYCKQASLWVIKKSSGDHLSSGGGSTTSNSMTNVVSLDFTPEETSDYLILASGACSKSIITSSMNIRLFDNNTATEYGLSDVQLNEATDAKRPWFTFVVLTGLSGPQSFAIEIAANYVPP